MAELKQPTTLGSNTVLETESSNLAADRFSFYSLFPSSTVQNESVVFKDFSGETRLGTIVGGLDVTITKSPTANSEAEGNTIVYTASASPVPLVQGRTINYHLSGTYSPSDLSPSSNVGSFVFPASSPGTASVSYTVISDGVSESPKSLSLTLTDVYPANSTSTTIEDIFPSYVGDTSAYIVGGANASFNQYVRDQQKFPFSSETSASSLGDQSVYAYRWRGGAGPTSGYIIGGIHYPSFPGAASYTNYQTKFPFSSETINSMPGWLTTPDTTTSGIFDHATHNDDSYLFVTGGRTYPSPTFANVERMPFSSEGSWIDIGELTYPIKNHGAHSSATDGYAVGGSPSDDTMLKFPFVGAGSMSTDIGELPYNMNTDGSGVSSSENGYTVGGGSTPNNLNNSVHKFPFSSDTPASTLVNQNTYFGATHSSKTDGYSSGQPGSTAINKFTFSSDANSSDIGELNTGIYGTPSAAFHT